MPVNWQRWAFLSGIIRTRRSSARSSCSYSFSRRRRCSSFWRSASRAAALAAFLAGAMLETCGSAGKGRGEGGCTFPVTKS
jgi:hypothetical protein